MKYSLVDTYSDDFGNLDFQRSQHGSGMSSKTVVRFILRTNVHLVFECNDEVQRLFVINETSFCIFESVFLLCFLG
jgi:hypothetical protein